VVIEHGMGGSRPPRRWRKDVLTYLFDKPRALAALAKFEEQWGGTLAERMEARAQRWLAAKAAEKASGGAPGDGR
jgi:penicillin-binding protein 2